MTSRTVTHAWRIRVYPTRAQRTLLPRLFGACRWLKAHALDVRSSAYRLYKLRLTGTDVSRMLTGWKKTAGHEWLAEVPATCFTQALRDQDRAFKNFFAGRAKYPRRPRRGHRASIRFQDVSVAKWEAGILSLPKLGELELAENLPDIWHTVKPRKPSPEGQEPERVAGPAMVTLTREPNGDYYISFTAEVEMEALPATGKTVGVDLGISTLATLSTGEKVHRGTKWRAKQRYLRRCQRALARCQKGSKRRQRARRRVAQAHAKVADHRRYQLHELTTRLVRENDRICIEDLNVKGLARGFLSAQIQDAAFGEFRRQLTYKSQWYGRELIVVNRYFASSKICWLCGWVNVDLTLSTRSWSCGGCCTHHDRDENAAKSLVAEGMRMATAVCKARDELPETAGSRPHPGCEGPGNGRRMREVTARRHQASAAVLANEASTRKAAADCLEQAAAA